MSATFTLLIGGARSGKSALAVEWGRRVESRGGAVVVVATAPIPAVADDADLADRIERHRHERPPWATVEEPVDLVGALGAAGDESFVVLDCLTLWVSNLMARGHGEEAIVDAAHDAAAAIARRPSSTVVVTNEVGLGVHPVSELGRAYRDALGRVNRAFADAADRTLLLVAGRVAELAPPGHFAP